MPSPLISDRFNGRERVITFIAAPRRPVANNADTLYMRRVGYLCQMKNRLHVQTALSREKRNNNEHVEKLYKRNFKCTK